MSHPETQAKLFTDFEALPILALSFLEFFPNFQISAVSLNYILSLVFLSLPASPPHQSHRPCSSKPRPGGAHLIPTALCPWTKCLHWPLPLSIHGLALSHHWMRHIALAFFLSLDFRCIHTTDCCLLDLPPTPIQRLLWSSVHPSATPDGTRHPPLPSSLTPPAHESLATPRQAPPRSPPCPHVQSATREVPSRQSRQQPQVTSYRPVYSASTCGA